jgi:hypothetical protein
MAMRNEVSTLRLYLKSPGTDRLRKGSAATLRHLLASGWHETHRTTDAGHVVVRLERPAQREPRPLPHGGDAARPRWR